MRLALFGLHEAHDADEEPRDVLDRGDVGASDEDGAFMGKHAMMCQPDAAKRSQSRHSSREESRMFELMGMGAGV